MKSFVETVTSSLAKVALVIFGLVAAGMGIAAFVLLALFGFAVAGLALLASPFIAVLQPEARELKDVTESEAAA